MKCGNGSGVRFSRKATNENERRLFQSYWQELTKLYGTYIDYYVYEYSLSAHDFFYGEHTLAPYGSAHGMNLLAQVNNDTLLLAKFGIQTDADVTFIMPIVNFREIYGPMAEPKAGDLIRMTELGWDRPGGIDDLNTVSSVVTSCNDILDPLAMICQDGLINDPVLNCTTDSRLYSGYDDVATFDTLLRGATVYVITERRDEVMNQNYNMLQGHYVWIIHAKKFDYNYQPNAPREPGMDQVSDETVYGKLSGGSLFPEKDKLYTQNVETDSNVEWDYKNRPHTDDGVYGDY